MPCPKCGSVLIQIKMTYVCPSCNNIKLLDRKRTIIELEKNLQFLETTLSTLLKNRVEKNRLLRELAWQREKFSRDFFSVYQPFDLNGFLSLNLLIFRVLDEPYFDARRTIDYATETREIVKALKKIINMKSQFLLFKEGLAEAIRLFDKISILPNEHYLSILKTYEDNDIWRASEAQQRLGEYQSILKFIISKQKQGSVKYSPEEFIENFYEVVNQFYCCFLRNDVYDEVFGLLKRYVEINLTPGKLMDFVNSYLMNNEKLVHTSVSEFIRRATKHFEVSEKKIREILLVHEHNPNSFPLFILISGRVYISHRTSFLVYILMHAIIYKDLFNRETEKRSKEFEKAEVKKTFESIGWSYFSNIVDKKHASLEIDGIATFEKWLKVVECKGWQLHPFFEYKSIQSYLERDIKGIVDGEKFTSGKPSKIPSLIEKLEFAKANMTKWALNPKDFEDVAGLVVMRSFPPIHEYKGVQILSIKAIPEKFDYRRKISPK